MKRKIVEIDAAKCNGCGLCAQACHEGAIAMVDGKARLMRDDYCDGMGDCLPACPAGAITITEREAAAYDEQAVAAHLEHTRAAHGTTNATHEQKENKTMDEQPQTPPPGGCPGRMARAIRREAPMGGVRSRATANEMDAINCVPPGTAATGATSAPLPSELRQWPVQIKLAPVKAPWFDGARLLVAADCTAYAYAAFHRDFIRGRITLIGCPKLDEGDYTEKLTAILTENDIRELVIVRMEVPCCGGLERAATNALKASGRFIPWRVVILAIDGRVID